MQWFALFKVLDGRDGLHVSFAVRELGERGVGSEHSDGRCTFNSNRVPTCEETREFELLVVTSVSVTETPQRILDLPVRVEVGSAASDGGLVEYPWDDFEGFARASFGV